MEGNQVKGRITDHCRIGSLEIKYAPIAIDFVDHCRIGSLEIDFPGAVRQIQDHCRIGSLEICPTRYVL